MTGHPTTHLSDKNLRIQFTEYDEDLQIPVDRLNETELIPLHLSQVVAQYHCSQLNGLPKVEMALHFKGCPTYTIKWLKSCGHDTVRKQTAFILCS